MGRHTNCTPKQKRSGAADSGESRDGGTRAVSFSDPSPNKTESGLAKQRLYHALTRGLVYDPDPDIVAMAKECVPMCGPGRNAEFLARGFNVGHEYFVELRNADAFGNAALLTAVEYGYRQCEKGHNLDMALAEAKKVLVGDSTTEAK